MENSVSKKKRQFIALVLSLFTILGTMPLTPAGLVKAESILVDGTTVSEPSVGSSYYFDFIKNSNLYSGTEGEFGLVTVAGKVTSNGHGAQYANGTSLTFKVAGSSKISIGNCTYDTQGTGFAVQATGGSIGTLPTFPAKQTVGCYDKSGQMYSFDYTATEEGTVNTVTIQFSSTYYIPYILIEPIAQSNEGTGNMPEANTSYSYDFSIMTTPSAIDLSSYSSSNPIDTLWSADGFLKVNGNKTMYPHGDKHGLVVYPGNSFDINVAGNAMITFDLCQYSNAGTITAAGGAVGSTFSKESISLKGATDGEQVTFAYSGDPGTLNFTITGNGYLHGIKVVNTTEQVETTTWAKKDFKVQIGSSMVNVVGALTQSGAASASVSEGKVYYALSESAFISTDLQGMNLTTSVLTNLSSDVVKSLSINGSGEVVVTFADQSTYPYEYRIKVQDTSAFMTPDVTDIYSFDFAKGAVPVEFTSSNPISESYTTDNGIVSVGKGTGTKNPYWHDNAHGIALNNENYIDVKVAGDASISFTLCGYGSGGTLGVTQLGASGVGTFDANVFKSAACNGIITYTYTGEATTLRFTLTSPGESYLHGITVKNTGTMASSPVANTQLAMPNEIDANGALTVAANGHRLYAGQSDLTSSISSLTNVGYYLFDARTDACTIEADVKITAVGKTSNEGVFFGMFEDATKISEIATLGIRGDGKVRNVYNKFGTLAPSAGSTDKTYAVGDVIHLISKKDSAGWYTEVTINSEKTSYVTSYPKTELLSDINTSVKYGFAFANVNAVITNLVFTDGSGKVLYDQNKCYDAVGTAPIVTSIEAPILSADRSKVTVNWNGDTPEDDATYVVELSTDGGSTYSILSSNITSKTYTTDIHVSGSYKFRVHGMCGSQTTSLLESSSVEVLAPLASTSVKLESGDGVITVNWNSVESATSYEIYRKSSEETNYTLLATVSELTYVDHSVANETPYYYYVVAKSSTNSSNGSEPVLSVPSAGHIGEYVYENEATNIFITKKSYDTVYTNAATLEGVVSKAGSMKLVVNDVECDTVNLAAQGIFSFSASLKVGRNDVNLYFTDEQGKVTRKTFNFVYLTNYDMIVDATYSGAQGAQLSDGSGVRLFSTVQAAVNAVPANNTERVVILVKEGNYVEHLSVASPYISLIGEDRDKVNLSFFDPVESPIGGDTSTRCATYIKATATGFSAENLTFENTYKYLGNGTISNESADALRVDADQSTFVNVKLLGYQDTLYASANHQYYYKCYILGNVDYIYGAAQALFNDCELVYRYSASKNSGYITAPKTSLSATYGYIFNNCKIYAEEGCSGSKYLLARPWGPDGAATFISSYMSSIVNPTTTYADMSGNLSVNARFYEYYTYGPGFAINSGRPQISKAQAGTMLTTSSLGWDPNGAVTKLSTNDYVGNVVTTAPEKFITASYTNEVADPNATDDTGLGKYSVEGYAANKGVTGGGLLLESSSNYYKVANAEQFLNAFSKAKLSGKASVIELTSDIALGSKEIGNALTTYSNLIKAASNQPLLHPTLLTSGVSTLKIENMSNLTIFSQSGAKLTHVCLDINSSSNIIIRNIVFDELWEWDEGGNTSSGEYCKPGDYDRNDWDYMTIENGSTGVWVDHCTFYKAYDGVIDMKKALDSSTMDVTISWSKFLPESQGSFFVDMMNLLEANPEKYPYYHELITTHGMTKNEVRQYAAAQKKTHLIGASDTEANISNLRLTVANNYYKNSMDRMPRVRGGNAHVYNSIMDATDVYNLKMTLTDLYAKEKIVSNGTISACGASVLVENSSMSGIINALLSGNGSSPGGAINAINSVYYMEGTQKELKVTDYAGTGLILNGDTFKKALPYSQYRLYNAKMLSTLVLPYAGAGNVSMSTVQWEKATYNDATNPGTTDPGTTNPGTTDPGTTNPGTTSPGTTNSESTDSESSSSSSSKGSETIPTKTTIDKLGSENIKFVVDEAGNLVLADGSKLKVSLPNQSDKTIKGLNDPIVLTIDLSNVTVKDSSKLTIVRYEKQADGSINMIKLGGKYEANTKTFWAQVNQEGNYGIIEAKELTKINLVIGNTVSSINDQEIKNDVAPEIVKGSTMVPIRFIAESLGAKVKWNEAKKEATITLNGQDLVISKSEGMLIKNSRMLVPVRYVSENFGAYVLWIPSTKEVKIVK